MDAIKERAVLQSASATDVLGEASRVSAPQFGANCKDGLRLGRKIESFACLVIVDPVHAIPVVEEG